MVITKEGNNATDVHMQTVKHIFNNMPYDIEKKSCGHIIIMGRSSQGLKKFFLPDSKSEFSKFPVEQSQNFLPLKAPSTQLGVFQLRGPILEKGTLNLLIEDTVCEYCFSDPLLEEYHGRFTDIIALKKNDSYC